MSPYRNAAALYKQKVKGATFIDGVVLPENVSTDDLFRFVETKEELTHHCSNPLFLKIPLQKNHYTKWEKFKSFMNGKFLRSFEMLSIPIDALHHCECGKIYRFKKVNNTLNWWIHDEKAEEMWNERFSPVKHTDTSFSQFKISTTEYALVPAKEINI
jgi:hypothetical protein